MPPVKIRSNVSLFPYNTFGIDARAAHLAVFHNVAELQEALHSPVSPRLVWGGGSNVVLRGDYPGLVLLNRVKGITITRTFEHRVHVIVGGGEGWHDFVLWVRLHAFAEEASRTTGVTGQGVAPWATSHCATASTRAW